MLESRILSSDTATLETYHAYLLGITQIPGMGCRTIHRLLKKFRTPEALWHAPSVELQPYLEPKQMAAWNQKKCDPFQLLETYHQRGIILLGLEDPLYPPLLKEIHNPPVLLFLRGNPKALTGRTLAVVGTRKITPYGRQVTETLVTSLSSAEVVIVSGLAQGVDGAAHQAALNAGLKTVAVFGCGIDKIFPANHRALAEDILAAEGALVSEYPLGYPGSKMTFPMRNRIVAGLSYGVVVIEGRKNSGSLITAKVAADENRTVFAVPGNIFHTGAEGPHALIRSGATPATCGEDILEELSWLPASGRKGNGGEKQTVQTTLALYSPQPSYMLPMGLGPEETSVMQNIDDITPTSIEILSDRTGLLPVQLSGILTMLELDGLVSLLPGSRVIRKTAMGAATGR